MTDGLVLGAIIGGAVVIAAVAAVTIHNFKKSSDIPSAEQQRAEEDRRLNDDGEIVSLHAEVLDMTCGVRMVGYKEPKAVKYFVIKLKSDDGEIINLPVSEEVYEGFDIGLSGMLTLIDGKLSSFELDEDFIEEELDNAGVAAE